MPKDLSEAREALRRLEAEFTSDATRHVKSKEIEVASDDLRKIRIALDAYEAQTKIGLKLEKNLHNALKALEEIKGLE